jgi:phenylalanyl-tRNA synthetase alpha chain
VLNEAVEALQAAVDAAKHRLGSSPAAADAAFDTTLPGTDSLVGGLHPILQMNEDLNCAFAALNFDMYSGPEISNELFEFDHMNFPAGHPARESMDTFWLSGSQKTDPARHFCLRPHLTGASVRFMAAHEPPYRFVYPGRVYRNESVDARHERAFFQYEALIVDRDVPFSSGKLLISTVLDTVFGRPVPTRMRTGFFPFVEPGFEIDMQCQVCSGAGCTVCKRVGWLEIMPGGVIHPEVLQAAGVDADEWTGFYVNVGLDRLVMMRYGIDDIRAFNGCDLRILEQFR